MGLVADVYNQRPDRTVEAAEETLAKLKETIADLEEEIVSLEQELPELREAASKDILDARLAGEDTQAKKIVADLTARETELVLARNSLETARQAQERAQKNLWLAQAAVKRQEADELRAQIEARKAKRAELLKPVEEFEGVNFVPYVPKEGTASRWKIPETQVLENQLGGIEYEIAVLEHNAGVRKTPPPQRYF